MAWPKENDTVENYPDHKSDPNKYLNLPPKYITPSTLSGKGMSLYLPTEAIYIDMYTNIYKKVNQSL